MGKTYIGNPCARGGHTVRYLSTGSCVECSLENSKTVYGRRREHITARQREYYRERREHVLARCAKRYTENKPLILSQMKRRYELQSPETKQKRRLDYLEWRRNNPEKARSATKNWAFANPGKTTAYMAKYRAARLQRTPSWADQEWIDHAYAVAKDMSQKMGERFHVDHIVPLQGKTVSGLHVYENLQILPLVENSRKGNRLLAEHF